MKLDEKARYYAAGGIESIDIVKAKLTAEQYRGYLLGTALVYQLRANHKGDMQRDIEKARLYLQWLEETEAEQLEVIKD